MPILARYSVRSAIDGSTRAARQAGTKLASADATSSTAAAPSHDTGSRDADAVERARDRARGDGGEQAAGDQPGERDEQPLLHDRSRRTAPGRAPSAMRIPISRVRRATEYAITP